MSDETWDKLIKLDPVDTPHDGIKIKYIFEDEAPSGLLLRKPRQTGMCNTAASIYIEDSDGLFRTPDGHVFGPEIMEDIEAAFDAILNEENPDEN